MNRLTCLCLALAPLVAHADAPTPCLRPTLVFETGLAYVAQNDGRYGATGTPYEASEVGQQDNLARTTRTSVELAFGRHTVILLYAPFALTTEVELERDLVFRDETFPAGSVVRHDYLFDGYRGSYLYRVVDRPRLGLELGGSVQIRNADVAFTSGDGTQRAHQSDIGVVAAAKARLWVRPRANGTWGALETDAFSTFGLLDGVSGGIYDLGLMVGQPIGRGVELVLVARLLGGGAEVEDKNIDNWANFVSFSAGVRIALDTLLTGR
jgi:hypothetical protein